MNNLKVIVCKNNEDVTSDIMNFYMKKPSDSIDISELNKYVFHDHPFYENILDADTSSINNNKFSTSDTPIPDILKFETPNIIDILDNSNLKKVDKTNNSCDLNDNQVSANMVAVDPNVAIPSISQSTSCRKQLSEQSTFIKQIKPKRLKKKPAKFNLEKTISSECYKYIEYISKANKQMNMLRSSFHKISHEIESNITKSFQLLQQPVRNKQYTLVHYLSEQINFTLPVLTSKFYSVSQKEELFTMVTDILQSINIYKTFDLTYRNPYICKGQSHVVCIINFEEVEYN